MRVNSGQFMSKDFDLYNNSSSQTLSKALDMSKKSPLVFSEG